MVLLLLVALMVPFQQQGYSTRSKTPRSRAGGYRAKNPVDYTKDGEFLKQTALHNYFFVDLFEWTKEHSGDLELRRAATEMLAMHTRFGEDLHKLAARKRVTLPDPATSGSGQARSFMESLKTDDIGRSFLEEVWNHCVVEIARFDTEAKQGSDPDIRRWTSEEITVFEKDQALVEPLKRQRRAP